MILNQLGQVFVYGQLQESFFIGQSVIVNGLSPFAGLTGMIIKIIDGDDMETENPGPDIY